MKTIKKGTIKKSALLTCTFALEIGRASCRERV